MSCTNINRNSNTRKESRKYLKRRKKLCKHIRIKSIELKTNLFKKYPEMYCRIINAVKCRMQWVTFVFVPCFYSLEVTKEESRIKERKILKKTEIEKFKLHYLAFRSRNEVSWFSVLFSSRFSVQEPRLGDITTWDNQSHYYGIDTFACIEFSVYFRLFIVFRYATREQCRRRQEGRERFCVPQ